MANPGSILIVEDEKDLSFLLDYNLKQAGFTTRVASTGEEALSLARAQAPSLVLLDLMLPDISGTEVCRELKRDPNLSRVPIVMLTARGEEVDRIVGFELGADDYVTKPFSIRELLLRVQAVLRRGSKSVDDVKMKGAGPVERLELGPILLDFAAHTCTIHGDLVELTAMEFRLLRVLCERAGRVQSRERLLEDVWEVSPEMETRTVDSHVKRLREKLGDARDWLETVRGVGYRLRKPEGGA